MTGVDREQALEYADEHGTAAAAERFGVNPSTVRSWRARAGRKIVDNRARDPEPELATAEESDTGEQSAAEAEIRARWAQEDAAHAEPGAPPARGAALVDVMIPDGGWDGGMGCETKTPAKARLVSEFVTGAVLASTAPNRDLGAPAGSIAGLTAGAIVLLGFEQNADHAGMVWEIVSVGGTWRGKHPYQATRSRPTDELGGASFAPTAEDPDPYAGWALLVVRPARVRERTMLSEDRSRLVPDTRPPPGHQTVEERLAAWDAQLDPHHDREQIWREQRERAERVQRDHPPA